MPPQGEMSQFAEEVIFADGSKLQQLFADVRLYEDLLNSTPDVQNTDVESIVNELDSRWPYYGDPVLITGKILTAQRVAISPAETRGLCLHFCSQGLLCRARLRLCYTLYSNGNNR